MDDYNFNKLGAWLLWFLERVADAAPTLDTAGWYLGTTFGPLVRGSALYLSGTTQILPNLFGPMSLRW